MPRNRRPTGGGGKGVLHAAPYLTSFPLKDLDVRTDFKTLAAGWDDRQKSIKKNSFKSCWRQKKAVTKPTSPSHSGLRARRKETSRNAFLNLIAMPFRKEGVWKGSGEIRKRMAAAVGGWGR